MTAHVNRRKSTGLEWDGDTTAVDGCPPPGFIPVQTPKATFFLSRVIERPLCRSRMHASEHSTSNKTLAGFSMKRSYEMGELGILSRLLK